LYVLVFISTCGFTDVTIQNTNQCCVTITITTWSPLFVCEVGATAHKGHIFRFPSVPLYTGLTVLCYLLLFFLITCIHIFQECIMDSYVIRCPDQPEWNIRAEIRCQNTTTYFCLYNYITYSYEEGCTGPDWDRPGTY
jgi:hypothetical protein